MSGDGCMVMNGSGGYMVVGGGGRCWCVVVEGGSDAGGSDGASGDGG